MCVVVERIYKTKFTIRKRKKRKRYGKLLQQINLVKNNKILEFGVLKTASFKKKTKDYLLQSHSNTFTLKHHTKITEFSKNIKFIN